MGILQELLLACLLVAVGGSSWPEVVPVYQRIQKESSHTVICRFGLALADCQLRVWEPNLVDSALNFRRGAESVVQPVSFKSRRFGGSVRATASYAGAGLGSGECGVRFSRVQVGRYMVQCAGKLAANGSWASGIALMFATSLPPLAASVATPRHIVAAAGTDVQVQLDAGRNGVVECSVETPGMGWQIVGRGRSLEAGSRFRLNVAGMRRGRCDWTLTDVTPADAGLWYWRALRGVGVNIQLAAVAVIAAPRAGPELHVRDAGTLTAGDVVEATCSAPAAVPPSELTWLLDGQILRRDTANDTLEGDLATWTLPWEPRPARQTLRRLLTSADIGKTLECRAQHVAEGEARTHAVVLGVAMAVSECGFRKVPAGMALSWGGTEAGFAEFPWHVAVFQADTDLAVCGGSLVTPSFTISAAVCFWDTEQRKPYDPTTFTIAAGKHSPEWDVQEEKEQRRNVKTIHIPITFTGQRNHLESDIAVAELAEPMRITPEVGVVCLDWTISLRHRHFARDGTVGTTPGWGVTENDTQSTSLRFVDLPFVPTTSCLALMPRDLNLLMTSDKFCGGFVGRDTSVCFGDTGGGYVFANGSAGGRYFLRGVVSSPPPARATSCRTGYPSLFTSISAYSEWLHDILDGVVVPDDY